jgi:sialidase-1
MSRLLRISVALGIFVTLVSSLPAVNPADGFDYLYKNGEEGYKCFRIPVIVKSVKGTVLAFAEGRKNGCSDTGSIDLVLKRSKDSGRTWGGLQVVWSDGSNTCGNPASVVDTTTGEILLLSTWNLGSDREPEIIKQESTDTRRVFLLKSSDDGKSWSDPEEITKHVKSPEWTWYATGPVHGIQLEKGPFRGRLIIPCDHIEAGSNTMRSHVIYSDDHGHSWKTGGIVPQDQVNECTIAELEDGRLLLNMRNYDRDQETRKISFSRDGGLRWSDIQSDPVLVEPVCQASMLMFHRITAPDMLLFMNPGSPEKRIKMTIRASFDQGRTWAFSQLLHPGPSAYSDMVQVNENDVIFLMEIGRQSPYEGIAVKGPVNISSLF